MTTYMSESDQKVTLKYSTFIFMKYKSLITPTAENSVIKIYDIIKNM
jgi:hypothetical protein